MNLTTQRLKEIIEEEATAELREGNPAWRHILPEKEAKVLMNRYLAMHKRMTDAFVMLSAEKGLSREMALSLADDAMRDAQAMQDQGDA